MVSKPASMTRDIVILGLVLIAFVVHSISLDFTQDDAYISYRYIDNFIEGHGLVFNYGERVEGYTNFLWIMLLSLFTLAGFPLITTSKVLGVAFGAGTVIFAYLLGREYSDTKRWYTSFIAPVLLAANGALCYWVTGGLETGMFVFLTALALYTEIKRPRLSPFVLILATLARPEGGLLFGIILLYRLFVVRSGSKLITVYVLSYVLPLIPYAVFKLVYFGDLLPNPFYAKTGMSIEYLSSGVEYFIKFAYHYGLFGLILLTPLPAVKNLPRSVKLYWLVSLVYTFYIIVVGGDVLKVHRFFLPILLPLFLMLAHLVHWILVKAGRIKLMPLLAVLFVAGFVIWSLEIPRGYIEQTRRLERGFAIKMTTVSESLNRIDDSDFSLATTTIGKVSYILKGHKVIDMLGLTDREIAKNPEKISGMSTTWKERNFNTQYLLKLKPDYILFSTGHKASAPAERALILNSQFRHNYATIGFIAGGKLKVVWKKYGDFSEPNVQLGSLDFADRMYDGLNLLSADDYTGALNQFQTAAELCGDDFPLAEHFIGTCYEKLGKTEEAVRHYVTACEMDQNHLEARMALYRYYSQTGDASKANKYRIEIGRLAPWLLN